MAEPHRSHKGGQRQSGAQAARATVLQQQLIQRQLIQRHPHLWPRFLAIYTRLQQLPRRWRRRLVRKAAAAKIATTLVGVALLLALSRAPARADNITVANGVVEVNDDDVCSLIEAILNAEAGGQPYQDCDPGNGADTIFLPVNGSFLLTAEYENGSALPEINTKITIEGNGATIWRDSDDPDSDEFRFFYINDSGDLTLNELTLQGGYTRDAGGALFNKGAVTITNSVIRDNNSRDRGGSIYNDDVDATLTITNSTLSGNEGRLAGSAIYNMDGTVNITGSIIYDNHTNSIGTILNKSLDATLTITNSTLSGNRAGAGGAIYNVFGTVDITGSIMNNNYASSEGGAIHNDGRGGKTTTITNSTLSGNRARDGGAIYNELGIVTITGSTLSDNESRFNGGAIYHASGLATLTIINSTISNNEAGRSGGGLFNFGASITITNSTITGNVATERGGGGVYHSSSFLTLNRTIISGNTSTVANELFNAFGTVNANNHNLFGHSGESEDTAFGGNNGFTPGATDINATSDGSYVALAAILETSLANNGGPVAGAPGLEEPILTHALASGSPAIDGAPSAACAAAPVYGVDQRGYFRNVDGRNDGNPENKECDIGAFEGFLTGQLFMTAAGPGIADGVAFGKEDILRIRKLEHGDWRDWELFFDGSAAGLTAKHDLNAIHVNAADDIYLSFFQNKIKTAGVGNVFGHDILHYDGSEFSLFFDGSDVGLTTTAEKIDALHILDDSTGFPGGEDCDTYLLISTLGTGKVPAAGGGNLKFQGEDILGFCLTNSGANTAGGWHMVLDGSAEGMPKNSTDSISASQDSLTLYLTTQGVFNPFGGHSMVYKLEGGHFSGPHFSAPENGLGKKVDGLHVTGDLP